MRADCDTDTDDEMEAKPTVPVTDCDTDAIAPVIETIFVTLERGDAENDVAGVGDALVVTVAIPPVTDTIPLDDTVCTVDSEEDGVKFEVPEN